MIVLIIIQQFSNLGIQQFAVQVSYFMHQHQPSRILVIRTGALGDTIVMSVVYQALRKHFPTAWIEVLGHIERLRLINTPGLINRLTSIDTAGFAALFLDSGQISDHLYSYFQQFDEILLYSVDSENTLYSNLCKICAQTVHGFKPFPPAGENIHITAYLLDSLQFLGIYETALVPEITFPETTADISPFDDVSVVVHPGSGSPEKNWPIENFTRICRRLITKYDARIHLVIGPADTFNTEGLAQSLPVHAVEVLRNWDVGQLAQHIRRCRLYLGNDSGISHLAAATRIPTVVLFGPSNPHVWRPIGPCVQIIQGNGEFNCQGISVETVWKQIDKINLSTAGSMGTLRASRT
jgi:ADP-heptose:LPS heptosyltransferase